jgi:zinc D-Ala-D-Ala carboxypeptidase
MHLPKYWILIGVVATVLVACQGQKKEALHTLVPKSVGSEYHVDTSSIFTLDYLMGKFNPEQHPDFMAIPIQYADQEARYIRKDVFNAFVQMYDAAAKEGIRLVIKSSARNFDNQKRIWENKWTGKTILEDNVNAAKDIKSDSARAKKILQYSSMPGSSRHHWGTDIDLNAFENEWFDQGEGKKLYQWMLSNADQFGFCQPYSAKGSDRHTGYFEERWHWTYVPVSQPLTEYAKRTFTDDKITGFLGSETAVYLQIVNNYVLGISPRCLTNK